MKNKRFIIFMALSIASLCGCSALYERSVARRIPPLGDFILTEGYSYAKKIDLHVVRAGQGDPLVYIHGNYGSVLDIVRSPLFPSLSERFELIAFDRPGYGFSERPDGVSLSLEQQTEALVKLLDALGIEKTDLLAHSFGGAVALRFAIDYPSRVRSLYLIAPASYPWPGDKVFFKDRVVQIPVLGNIFLETLFLPIAYVSSRSNFEEVFNSEYIPDDYFYPARDLAIRPTTFLNTALDMRRLWFELEEQQYEYPRLELPIRIVHGSQDTSTYISVHSARLDQDAPNSELKEIKGAGHSPHFTHPSQTLEFLFEMELKGK